MVYLTNTYKKPTIHYDFCYTDKLNIFLNVFFLFNLFSSTLFFDKISLVTYLVLNVED